MLFNTAERLRNLNLDLEEIRRKAGGQDLRVPKPPHVLLQLFSKHNRDTGAVFKKNIPNDFGINTVELHESLDTAIKEFRRTEEVVEDFQKPEFSYSNMKQELRIEEDPFQAIQRYNEHNQSRNIIEAELNSNYHSRNVYKSILKTQIKHWDEKIDNLVKCSATNDELINNIGVIKAHGISKNIELEPVVLSYANHIHIFALNKQKITKGRDIHGKTIDNTSFHSNVNIAGPDSFMDSSFGSMTRVMHNQPYLKYLKHLSMLIDNFIDLNDNKPIKEILVDSKNLLTVYMKGIDGPDLLGNMLKSSCEILGNQAFIKVKMNIRPQRLNKIEDYPNLNSINNYIEEYIIKQNFDSIHRVRYDNNDIPIWALIYYAMRLNCLKDLKEFLNEYNGNMIQEIQPIAVRINDIIKGNYVGTMHQSHGISDDVFKIALQCLFSPKSSELPEDFLVDKIEDYLWFSLFKLLIKHDRENDMKSLHQKIKELEKVTDPSFSTLEIAKYQLLCLMMPEFLMTLMDSEEHTIDGPHIGFVFFETGILDHEMCKRDRETHNIENKVLTRLSDFAGKISRKFPLESFSYFSCIADPEEKSTWISNFLVKHSQLFEYIFGPNNQQNLQRLKENLGVQVYELLLKKIAMLRPAEFDKFNVCRLRVLEELGNVSALLDLIIEQEFLIFTRTLKGQRKGAIVEELTPDMKNAFYYLDKLFEKHNADKSWRSESKLHQVVIAKKLRKLIQMYIEPRSASELLEFIKHLDFFDIPHIEANNKLKLMILKSIEIALNVIAKYLSNLKPHSLNYETQIRGVLKQLKRLNDFYNECFREFSEDLGPEKDGLDVDEIKEKINNAYYEIYSAYQL